MDGCPQRWPSWQFEINRTGSPRNPPSPRLFGRWEYCWSCFQSQASFLVTPGIICLLFHRIVITMNSINPQLIGRIQSALERTQFPPFNFKLNQLKCLSHLLDGHDVIGVLPTGFGKSLIYQLLPLILPQKRNRNILLVVSPLSSIILDQATILEERGITYSYCYIFEYNIFVCLTSKSQG